MADNKKIIAAEKANFLEIANLNKPDLDQPITKLSDITIEDYMMTAFGGGDYKKGQKVTENPNSGMLSHLDEYASKLVYSGDDVNAMIDEIRGSSVEEFFTHHLTPFSEYINEKGYSGYEGKFKQLRMVGSRYNISHNVVPIQILKDLEGFVIK